ncbi:MAG: hypothetical protein ACI4F1_08845 [Bariatricus sp.]
MEITKREVAASITIIALWIAIGIAISGKIDEWHQDKTEEYDRAARITEQELFEHGMATNLGNAFVYGELKAKDPVSYPEIKGEYSYIKKVKEQYTKHTRTVTRTKVNEKGETETYEEEEEYWTWDEVDEENKKAKEFTFLGNVFSEEKFTLPSATYIETIKESDDIRYKYYTIPGIMEGTIYTELKDGTIKDSSIFYKGETIEEVTKRLEINGGAILFWLAWIIAMVWAVYKFFELENEWLNKG